MRTRNTTHYSGRVLVAEESIELDVMSAMEVVDTRQETMVGVLYIHKFQCLLFWLLGDCICGFLF